ncbi:Mannosyl-oligosaccharide 1,2-alpha-mannosidase IA, partial [Borealophlyctis nickersoniae]
MMHAWDQYALHAWGADEVRPVEKKPRNWYDDHSLLSTPVDALDTLHIMNLTSRFQAAKSLIIESLHFELPIAVNVFETTIRILGGLLSGYELDGDQRLLRKAVELGNKLLSAFQTPNGFPLNYVNLTSGYATDSNGGATSVNLAEIGTLQLEFQYLTDVTGNPEYAEKALFVFEQLHAFKRNFKGLYTLNYGIDSTTVWSGSYGIGAGADSFYEYLLKVWLATGEERYRVWYDEAAQDIATHLVQVSGQSVYVPDAYHMNSGWSPQPTFHHLTCFAGGMFAMGALTHRRGNWTHHLDIGRRITETCMAAYKKSPVGIAGETTYGSSLLPAYPSTYFLRPELVESLFYMWRFTHDPIYREWGWEIVQALEKHCKVDGGYRGLNSVTSPTPSAWDTQESFFLAETLKYLYLLYTSDDVIPLEQYVFNTEAHPVSVRGHGRRADPRKWVPVPTKNAFYKEVGTASEVTEEDVERRRKAAGERSAYRQMMAMREVEKEEAREKGGRMEVTVPAGAEVERSYPKAPP